MPAKSDHEALYDIPVEVLHLSEKTLQIIKSTGITIVGDCFDHFLRGSDAMITVPFGFIGAMEYEVKQKLAEHGYGTFD